MYLVRGSNEPIYQGDIINDFPVVLAPDTELRIISSQKTGKYPQEALIDIAAELPDAFEKGLERVIVDAYKRSVMVISHTCDIENRELCAVAPIFELSFVTNADRKRSIMSYKVNYRFFLPSYSGIINDSYVDLVIINTVKKESIDKNKRVLSLDEHGRSLLVHSLYTYFCRPVITET